MKMFILKQIRFFNRNVFKTLALLVLLASCDGDQPIGGIKGTGKVLPEGDAGLIIGQIDSVTDLTIDGISFAAANSADVMINGNTASVEELRIGMPVTARVDYGELTVESIDYQPLLSGPISVASDDKSVVEVLGQTIQINSETFLDDLTTEDVDVDNVIEVAGQRDKNGLILAEYIRVPDLAENYYVVGNLTTTDEMTHSTVSGTPVDLESVSSENGPNSGLGNGSVIRAEVTPEVVFNPETPIEITDVQIVLEIVIELGSTILANGIVSQVFDNGDLEIKGLQFRIDENTQYFDNRGNAVDPVLIEERQVVFVTGVSTGTGVVIARKVVLRN